MVENIENIPGVSNISLSVFLTCPAVIEVVLPDILRLVVLVPDICENKADFPTFMLPTMAMAMPALYCDSFSCQLSVVSNSILILIYPH